MSNEQHIRICFKNLSWNACISKLNCMTLYPRLRLLQHALMRTMHACSCVFTACMLHVTRPMSKSNCAYPLPMFLAGDNRQRSPNKWTDLDKCIGRLSSVSGARCFRTCLHCSDQKGLFTKEVWWSLQEAILWACTHLGQQQLQCRREPEGHSDRRRWGARTRRYLPDLWWNAVLGSHAYQIASLSNVVKCVQMSKDKRSNHDLPLV